MRALPDSPVSPRPRPPVRPCADTQRHGLALADDECARAISCHEETVLAIMERLRAYLVSLPDAASSSASGGHAMAHGGAMRQPSNNSNISNNRAGHAAEMPGRETIFAAKPNAAKTSPRRDRRHSHGNSAAAGLTVQQIIELERQAEQQEQMQQQQQAQMAAKPRPRKLKLARQQQPRQQQQQQQQQVRFDDRRARGPRRG